ncbi:MAG: hypothetical protein ABI648_07785 [Betaproteobacteria bacterium]
MPNPFLQVAVVLLVVSLSGGCAALQRRPPPTIDQVVEMARSGKSADAIVRELQETRAVYPLTATQIVGLHDQGVPDAALDYMQNAYVESIRRDARMQYEGSFWWHDCLYCYGGPVIVVPR